MRQDMQTAIEKVNYALGLSDDEPAAPEAINNAAAMADFERMMGGLG